VSLEHALPRAVHAQLRANDARRITIELWPTAYRFKQGHRMRLQQLRASSIRA
jgi:predicted acyl esterase